MNLLSTVPHKRWNPLEREWVLVSPHRTQRPWQGQVETLLTPAGLDFDPSCYLCPGNERAGGHRNPPYTTTYAFDNDFAALKPDVPAEVLNQDGLIRAESERGLCRVVCFSPIHHLTIPRMPHADVRRVVDVWSEEHESIASREWVRYVQVFENRGEMMGASNPHPHCQIWASQTLPNRVEREFLAQREYQEARSSCLLCDYLKLELAARERVVVENSHFAALVPFWAVWPFEILVLAKTHVARMQDLADSGRDALADILRQVTTRFDNLFQVPFPYSMGFHGSPCDGDAHEEWHFHAHYAPPLLRSATVRKFMVGFELMGTPQRDITAESAAERLRAVPGIHYSASA